MTYPTIRLANQKRVKREGKFEHLLKSGRIFSLFIEIIEILNYALYPREEVVNRFGVVGSSHVSMRLLQGVKI